MPDPLTLECPGCREEEVSTIPCTLESLTFEGSAEYRSYMGYNFLWSITLTDDDALSVTVDTDGSFSIDLSPVDDWIDAFGSLKVRISATASLLQVFDPGHRAELSASFHLKATYSCASGDTFDRYSYTSNVDKDICYYDEELISFICAVGRGGGSIIMYRSSPFAECYGCTQEANGIVPYITRTAVDSGGSGEVMCLCASGGTPPYHYMAAGLAPGLTLDAVTGCVLGKASSGSSRSMTFTVTDADRNTASVVCTLLNSCGTAFGNDFS